MKVKRSERLVEMTAVFMRNPMKIYALDEFVDAFNVAKSSISEDIMIIRDIFVKKNFGEIRTYSGARGGVQFLPAMSASRVKSELLTLRDTLNGSQRLLPGGYVYLTDILSDPSWLTRIGRVVASKFVNQDLDAIVTIETKGIPLAQAVAHQLNVPFVIVRKTSKVTEGSTIGISYLPRSSSHEMKRMELSTRILESGARVLIMDDFLRGGGTLRGLNLLAEEIECEVVDSIVLIDHFTGQEDFEIQYKSLFEIEEIDLDNDQVKVKLGSILDYNL